MLAIIENIHPTLIWPIRLTIKDWSIENSILVVTAKNIDSIYEDDVDAEIKNSINDELDKYMNKNYLKQIIEGVDFKLLVKDTTLINNIKEAGDRYLFTINNSRLLNNKE